MLQKLDARQSRRPGQHAHQLDEWEETMAVKKLSTAKAEAAFKEAVRFVYLVQDDPVAMKFIDATANYSASVIMMLVDMVHAMNDLLERVDRIEWQPTTSPSAGTYKKISTKKAALAWNKAVHQAIQVDNTAKDQSWEHMMHAVNKYLGCIGDLSAEVQ
jgi:hypothetical protein